MLPWRELTPEGIQEPCLQQFLLSNLQDSCGQTSCAVSRRRLLSFCSAALSTLISNTWKPIRPPKLLPLILISTWRPAQTSQGHKTTTTTSSRESRSSVKCPKTHYIVLSPPELSHGTHFHCPSLSFSSLFRLIDTR